MIIEFGNTDRVLQETEKYLEESPASASRLGGLFGAHTDISDLFPQTIQKFFAGSYFPLVESKTELSISVFLVKRGLYRHAFVSLRTVLELGLLSVYWDRSDRSETEISDWLGSKEDTPFMSIVRRELKSIPNVAAYNKHDDLFGKNGSIQRVYKQLNNFAHVRGLKYSVGMLGDFKVPGSAITEFSSETLGAWIELANKVIKLIVIVHLLKYPVGLQETPIAEKFGLNGSPGGLLDPLQAERLREFVGHADATILQSISDSDLNAVEIGREIRAMPDLSEDQWDQQILRQNQFTIENQGYESWYSMHSSFHRKGSPEEIEKFEMSAKSLKGWATEKGWLERGRFG